MMKNILLKRGLALFLVLIMCIGILPVSALAAGNSGGQPAVSQLAHKHTWGKWTVTKKATCTEKGLQKRTCSGCGKTETKEIPKKPHNFKHEVTEPDSTAKDGKKTRIIEWVVTKPATCTEKGEKERTCTVCGKVEKKEIKKKDHSFGKWEVTKPATCSEKGEQVRTCSVCGKTETKEIKRTEHSFSDWEITQEATCAADGEKSRTCSACGKTETKVIEKKEHSFSEWEVTQEATCAAEGEKTRTCTVCGKTETKAIEKKEHSFSEWEVTQEATCSAEGEKTRTCTVCGKTETKAIEKTEHSFGDWEVTKEPTCTAEGEKARTCTGCGKTETKAIEKTEHSFGDWVVTLEPTCTAEGEKARTCTGCGKTETKTVEKTEHSYGDWEVTKEPTCTAEGENARTCTGCGSTETEKIKKTEHKFSEWKVTKEATCEEKGERIRECAGCDKTEKEEIKAKGHDFGDDWICKVCGAVSKDKPEEKLITITYTASEGGKVSVSSETVNVLDKKAAAKGSKAEASVGDWYFTNWTDAKGKVVSRDPGFAPSVDKKSGDMAFTANYVLMPASGSTVSADGVTLSYSCKAGTFPDGTEISVSALSTEKAKEFVAKATGKKIVDAVAFDITFSHDGKAVQPANGNGVDISVNFRKLEGTNPVFVHEGSGTKSGGTKGSATNSSAEFFATHFSIYAVGTEGYYRRTYLFYDKAGTEVVSKQTVREKESLYDPGVSGIGEGEEFLGWILKGSDPETADPKTIVELNAELVSAAFTQDETLEYIPLLRETGGDTETEITVKYDLNGGTGTIPDRKYKAGDTAVAAAAPVAPEGRKFMHWAYGGGKKIAAGGKFKVDENDAEENVITLKAVYEELKYTSITFDGNGGTINGETQITKGPITVNEAVDVPSASTLVRNGYVFTGWNTKADGNGVPFPADQAQIAADNIDAYGNPKDNILYAQWREILSITVTVIGGAKLDGNEIDNETGIVQVVYDGKEHRIDGYTVIAKDSDNNIITDYKATDVSITKKASAKGTDVNEPDDYCMGVTKDHCVNLNKNYNVTFEVKDGTLKITKRPVTLKSETASKTYDGKALKKPTVTGGEAFVSGEVTELKATGTVTNVSEGEVANKITYKTGDKFKAGNYDIKKDEGTLKIDPLKVTVTVTGKTSKVDYDGKEHKVTGYVLKATDKLYKESDLTFSGKAEAKGKNTGTYQMGLKASQFKNKNKNFTVTFIVNDGKLMIVQPKTIVITVNGRVGVKAYNGSYQSVEGFDVVKVEGAPKGKESSITKQVRLKDGYKANTGGWRPVGTYYMNLTADYFKPIAVDGYNVVFAVNDGCMVINPAPVTVTADSITKIAGEKDPVLKARVTGLFGNDTISYTLKRESGENAGTYRITPSGNIRQGQYTVTYISGTLTITDRSGSPSKTDADPSSPGDPSGTSPETSPKPSTEPPEAPETAPSVPTPVIVDVIEPEPGPDNGQEPEEKAEWSLLNLLLGIVTTIVGAVTGLSMLDESATGTAGKEKGAVSLKWSKLFGLIPAAASVITFLLTEDMSAKLVFADKWSILMIAYAIVGGVTAFFTRNKKPDKK